MKPLAPTSDFSLPAAQLLRAQSERLAGLRARVLRRAAIARRRCVLELGCGYGAVAGELVRRSGALVVALDQQLGVLTAEPGAFRGAQRLCANATHLPLSDTQFDLVFAQFALMWMDLPRAVAEVHRVLLPDGVLIAIEPDYGAMIEHPPEMVSAPLWQSALARAGADPLAGRKLPGLLAALRFQVQVDLVPQLLPPEHDRFALLRDLPLDGAERNRLEAIENAERHTRSPWSHIAHLPVFIISATK